MTERARPVTAVLVKTFAISCTAVKESGLAAGKPASIAEIPHFSNCLAMETFSLIEKFTPGVCSPSRRLVSKNSTLRIGSPHFYVVDIKKNISLGQPSEMFLPAW